MLANSTEKNFLQSPLFLFRITTYQSVYLKLVRSQWGRILVQGSCKNWFSCVSP